ncbi:Aste57867_23982 [Aphanomyces stellatus]|uniref:Aste57867_23982 protein n=1 Tax=Aphanomyces stellatus TaxID=120398 RepID=A0A485LP28_9STRA|nr:hypothetical protein As57867_023909 [Aphanomyces stellatus]VFU00625.1 Aste57867_23982 [Aphanomyces stellatus]
MYGSLIPSSRGETGPSRLATYAVLGVSVIVLLSVIHLVFLTNEVVAMLRPPRVHAMPAVLTAVAPSPSLDVTPPHILIVHSGDDNLRQFGAEVARGVASVPSLLRVVSSLNATFDDVRWADGILLGTNVYNANVDPVLTQWINTWKPKDFELSSKVAGAFAVAGGVSAGEELTTLSLLHSMLVFRLVVVGGETWTSAFGATAVVGEGPFKSSPVGGGWPSVCYRANQTIPAMFLDKAFGLGRRVTQVASKLKAT